MNPLKAFALGCAVILIVALSSVLKYHMEGAYIRHHANKEKVVNELPPLTEDEFKQVQEYLREQKRKREENRPEPQGDYQWDGGYSFNGGFGEYQALFFKGKKIGGMFAPGSGFPNEYHSFSEDGGVGKKCEPPVPHLKPKN